MDILISLCTVSSQNSEALARTIESVLPIVDEVVVVLEDQEFLSVDFGLSNIQVIKVSSELDLTEKRNLALHSATSSWILWLNPGESVSEEDLSTLKHLAIDPSLCFALPVSYSQSSLFELPAFRYIQYAGEETVKSRRSVEIFSVRLFPRDRRIQFSGEEGFGRIEPGLQEIIEYRVVKSRVTIKANLISLTGPTAHRQEPLKAGDLSPKLSSSRFERDWSDLHREGVHMARQREFSASLTLFFDALQLNPKSLVSWIELGRSFSQLKRFNEAQECFSAAHQIDPQNAEPFFQQGVLSQLIGNHQQAKIAFSEAIERNPNHVVALRQLGISCTVLGEIVEAIKAYQEALSLLPGSGRIKANLGAALTSVGQVSEAKRLLQEAIEDDPSLLNAYLLLAETYRISGQLEEASEIFGALAEVAAVQGALHGSAELLKLSKESHERRILMNRKMLLAASIGASSALLQ